MTSLGPPRDIRPFNSLDTSEANFIKQTWVRSIRTLQPWSTHDNDAFATYAHKPIEDCIEHPETMIAVACNPKDRSHIYGYAIGDLEEAEEFCLHMVYVAKNYREFGIARELVRTLFPELGQRPITFTTHTIAARSLKRKYDARHNLFLLHPRFTPVHLRQR